MSTQNMALDKKPANSYNMHIGISALLKQNYFYKNSFCCRLTVGFLKDLGYV